MHLVTEGDIEWIFILESWYVADFQRKKSLVLSTKEDLRGSNPGGRGDLSRYVHCGRTEWIFAYVIGE